MLRHQKIQRLQLALGNTGQRKVLEALASLPGTNAQQQLFKRLIELLRVPQARDDMQVAILQLLNVLVNTPEDLEERMPSRTLLHSLQIIPILKVQ